MKLSVEQVGALTHFRDYPLGMVIFREEIEPVYVELEEKGIVKRGELVGRKAVELTRKGLDLILDWNGR